MKIIVIIIEKCILKLYLQYVSKAYGFSDGLTCVQILIELARIFQKKLIAKHLFNTIKRLQIRWGLHNCNSRKLTSGFINPHQ